VGQKSKLCPKPKSRRQGHHGSAFFLHIGLRVFGEKLAEAAILPENILDQKVAIRALSAKIVLNPGLF
jgi:hypothetical protein